MNDRHLIYGFTTSVPLGAGYHNFVVFEVVVGGGMQANERPPHFLNSVCWTLESAERANNYLLAYSRDDIFNDSVMPTQAWALFKNVAFTATHLFSTVKRKIVNLTHKNRVSLVSNNTIRKLQLRKKNLWPKMRQNGSRAPFDLK